MTLKNFQVIDLIFTKQWPVVRVSDTLKMNRARVHLLKFRALRLLRKELARLEKGII